MAESWTQEEMAGRVAADFRSGEVVNLGIGLPTLVARFTPASSGVIFHSENGIVGMGPAPTPEELDPDLVDAGKSPVTLVPGAAIIAHDESFGIIRGGHLDCAVLGAYQVSGDGDLASWRLPGTEIGSVGGAMDIAVGARRVVIMMRHTDKDGNPKIVERCTFPLTARRCVKTIVTELAVLDLRDDGLWVRESVLEPDALQAVTGVPLRWS